MTSFAGVGKERAERGSSAGSVALPRNPGFATEGVTLSWYPPESPWGEDSCGHARSVCQRGPWTYVVREDEREAELVAVGGDLGVAAAGEDAGHVDGSTASDESEHLCCAGERAWRAASKGVAIRGRPETPAPRNSTSA